jgi:hypothetical protein
MIPDRFFHATFTGAADTQHEKRWRLAIVLPALPASGS